MNNKLYLLGGFNEDNKLSSQVFVTSLDTLSSHQLNWQSAPNTPWCRSTPVVMYDKCLLTVGGWQQNHTPEVYIFNPSSGQWQNLTNIPAARSAPAVVSAVDIIIIGGITNKNNEFSNTVSIGMFE